MRYWKKSSTDAWTTKTNTSFLEFVYGFTAVQLQAGTHWMTLSMVYFLKVWLKGLDLKGWSGVYLFGGVRYNYGYNAKVFIMDDTGLWLPYPQQLQARLEKNLTKGSRDNYPDDPWTYERADLSQKDFFIRLSLLVMHMHHISFTLVVMKAIRSSRYGSLRWEIVSNNQYLLSFQADQLNGFNIYNSTFQTNDWSSYPLSFSWPLWLVPY